MAALMIDDLVLLAALEITGRLGVTLLAPAFIPHHQTPH